MKLFELRKGARECDAIRKRMDYLIKNYLSENYVVTGMMFGFPTMNIRGKQELWGRICELADLLNIGRMGFENPDTGEKQELIFSGPLPKELNKLKGVIKNE